MGTTVERKEVFAIVSALSKLYPDAHCELNFSTPFELLIATILSAQCTDKRVNEVTKKLFKAASTPLQFAQMDIVELEKLIYSCGFYKNKAKNIIACAHALLQSGGEVPDSFEELLNLPGVGRKTANVVMSNAFNGNNIAVDTHVFRVSKRLGLSDGKTPYEVERDLMACIDENEYSKCHHLLIFHGRYCCKSRSPECEKCSLSGMCKYYNDKLI